MTRRRLLLVALAAVTVGACTLSSVGPRTAHPVPSTTPFPSVATSPTTVPTTSPASTVPTPVRPPDALVAPCEPPGGTTAIGADAIESSRQLVESLVCSASDVVVTEPDTAQDAVHVAAGLGAPLVFATPDQPYDPTQLGASRVWTPAEELVVGGRHSILPLPDVGAVPPLRAQEALMEVDNDTIRESQRGADPASTLMVLSSDVPALGAPAGIVADLTGATTVWSPPGDLRRRRMIAPLAKAADSRLLVGGFNEASTWQMDVLAKGVELPGGGQVLFPGRRMVALYGHPHTPGLGALGEQPVEEAIDRVRGLAEEYATEDASVLPVFEIIATTASASAGADGDYSAELAVEEIRPWVDAAAEAGIYVVLDLQPGRTDFLTQARRYEELLRLPHVGLALDPEWRLGPNQKHLNQIGTVTADEVNQVVDWLASIVREDHLPQKLLVLHQFRLSMIQDRHQIRTPSELAVVVHMDGQGPLATKYETWQAVLAGGGEGWQWGWKNFYDEDSPMATPAQVLDLEPTPVFISYQ